MAKNVRIKVKHKGSLKKYGFKMNESESKQLKVLKKADKAYGSGEVDKKLAALETFNKGNHLAHEEDYFTDEEIKYKYF